MDAGPGPGTDMVDGGSGEEEGADPFAAQPDESEGLTNVSADLEAVLENGELEGACERYEATPQDRRAKLLCGKWMFFYESFNTAGVPEPLMKAFIKHFPDRVGTGWEADGMIADPSSDWGRPLGFGPSKPLGTVDTVAFTCASCHFAKLSDGRFAVGAPNHQYEYGRQLITLFVVPQLLVPGADLSAHHPDALALAQPFIDELNADPLRMGLFLLDLAPLLGAVGGPIPTLSREGEGLYASWAPGTMDFIIEPLPLDDGVHTISKISALWGIPRVAEIESGSAALGWTGGVTSVMEFLQAFVLFGGGEVESWPVERLEPLAEYIYSLRAPTNPSPPEASLVAAGRAAFFSEGCIDCHGGPRGSGTELYAYEDIGTDPALQRWMDADLDGEPCCGVESTDPGSVMTHRIKSPRLTGMWAFDRFLHNGSVDNLEAIFCLDGPRGTVVEPPYGDGGHLMTCELEEATKRALVAFLRTI